MLITIELIKSGSSHTKHRKQETVQEFLKRLTHLHLNSKHISKIACFLSEFLLFLVINSLLHFQSALDECVNLEVLYLYDNELKLIENLGPLSKLTHLYLQDNQISAISNIGHLTKLEKLSLDRNHIFKVICNSELTLMIIQVFLQWKGQAIWTTQKNCTQLAKEETHLDNCPLKRLLYHLFQYYFLYFLLTDLILKFY